MSHLTPVQLAARFQVHPGTLANWRVRGDGPKFIKIGKRVAYRLADVTAWEEKQTRANTSQTTRKGKR